MNCSYIFLNIHIIAIEFSNKQSNFYVRCPDHVYERLMETQKNAIEKHGIQATQLCTHKESAMQINQQRIKQLKGDEKVFRAKDSSPEYSEQMTKALPVEKRLVLKLGAQVI